MKKKIQNQRSGAVNLIMVLFLSILSVLIIATLQSRILLSIYRMRSFSDFLTNSYTAESHIYDLLARLKYPGFTLPTNTTFTQPDGTKLSVTSSGNQSAPTIRITAKREFSVITLEAAKTVTNTTTSSGSDKVEIALMLDCTGSMNGNACSGSGCSAASKGKTRIAALKEATISFVDAILAKPQTVRQNILLGIGVFGVKSAWIQDAQDNNLSPSTQHEVIRQAVVDGFTANQGSSDACKLIAGGPGGTNIGGGYIFAHNYFAQTQPNPNTKRVEILITDGNPNTRQLNTDCPQSIACSYSQETFCMPYSRDYMRCALATLNQNWKPDAERCDASCQSQTFGMRNPNIEAFGVTVNSDISQDVVNIFTKYAGPLNQNYYRTEDASNLNPILQKILGTVVTTDATGTKIQIRRITQ